jgi:hypothetical protein
VRTKRASTSRDVNHLCNDHIQSPAYSILRTTCPRRGVLVHVSCMGRTQLDPPSAWRRFALELDPPRSVGCPCAGMGETVPQDDLMHLYGSSSKRLQFRSIGLLADRASSWSTLLSRQTTAHCHFKEARNGERKHHHRNTGSATMVGSVALDLPHTTHWCCSESALPSIGTTLKPTKLGRRRAQ